MITKNTHHFGNTFFSILALVGLLGSSVFYPVHYAFAAPLTGTANEMSRLAINENSDHAVRFVTPSGVTSGQTIVLTFPSDFDGTGLAVGDVDLSINATPNGVCDGTAQTLVASGASTSQWNAVFSSTENRVLTLTSGGASAIAAAGSEICVQIGTNATGGTNQYDNPSSAGSYTITLAAGADSGSVLVNIVNDDQVVVSAVVDQTLSFSISDNTIGFGSLSASNARFATGDTLGDTGEIEAHTIVVGTNASNGYTMTIDGTTLTSGGDTIDAIGDTNSASSTGTEQFGLRLTATGGSGTVSAPYAASGYAFDTAAFPDAVASAGGVTSDTTYSARYIANISSNTEAGNYAATITYVATANF